MSIHFQDFLTKEIPELEKELRAQIQTSGKTSGLTVTRLFFIQRARTVDTLCITSTALNGTGEFRHRFTFNGKEVPGTNKIA